MKCQFSLWKKKRLVRIQLFFSKLFWPLFLMVLIVTYHESKLLDDDDKIAIYSRFSHDFSNIQNKSIISPNFQYLLQLRNCYQRYDMVQSMSFIRERNKCHIFSQFFSSFLRHSRIYSQDQFQKFETNHCIVNATQC